MRAYSIFDDFPADSVELLTNEGIDVTVHPFGAARPDEGRMKQVLEEYDCVIIGTSQKITEKMFDNVSDKRIIATASVGVDHINIPEEKKDLVTIINTPEANAQSVAEYTMGCALACCKRLEEGRLLYLQGKNNKNLHQKPGDLRGKTIGVIGAGNISVRIMEYARFLDMNILCWTAHPDRHVDLQKLEIMFTSLENLVARSDVISVNLPNNAGTQNLISEKLINKMKNNSIFISVSRLQTVDCTALFQKAMNTPEFYVCLDLDVDKKVVEQMPDLPNVLVTPHIAGGTVETRKRMFQEVAGKIVECVNGK